MAENKELPKDSYGCLMMMIREMENLKQQRIDHLLEANNRYLERARLAEGRLKAAVEFIDQKANVRIAKGDGTFVTLAEAMGLAADDFEAGND